MKSNDLPTDEDYLDSLFVAPEKPFNPTDNPDFLNEAASKMLAAGAIPGDISPVEFVKAMFDPGQNFRGFKAKILVEEARKTLPESSSRVLSIHLGFLHLDDLNGFAARTPRGNVVIVLNMGILLHALLLGRCMLALKEA